MKYEFCHKESFLHKAMNNPLRNVCISLS